MPDTKFKVSPRNLRERLTFVPFVSQIFQISEPELKQTLYMSCRECRQLFLYPVYFIIGNYDLFYFDISAQKYDYFYNYK